MGPEHANGFRVTSAYPWSIELNWLHQLSMERPISLDTYMHSIFSPEHILYVLLPGDFPALRLLILSGILVVPIQNTLQYWSETDLS